MNIFLLVLFTILTNAYGQSVVDCPESPGQDTPFYDAALKFTSTCSTFDLKMRREGIEAGSSSYGFYAGQAAKERGQFDLPLFSSSTSEEFCNCLISNKFNEIRVPEKSKISFNEKHIEMAVAETFKKTLKNLFLNVIKFKNLNLSEDLHNKSKTMCSPDLIVKSVKELNCPGAAFDEKVQNIFGTGGIDNYASTMKLDYLGLNTANKACISKQEFLRLRSADKLSNFALPFAKSSTTTIREVIHTDGSDFDTVQFPNLLSYDLLFSLGYQYPEFNKDLRDVLQAKYEKSKILNVSETIYTDQDVQDSAYNAIEKNCGEMKEHLKSYFCGSPDSAVDAKNLSLIVDAHFKDSEDQDPNEFQSTKDYFTGKYACASRTPATPGNKKFNEFLESSTLTNRVIPDVTSDDRSSEYSKFNAQFCNGRGKDGSIIQVSDLTAMMKEFIDAKKNATPSIDLRKFFEDSSVISSLNLKINIDSIPTFTRHPIQEDGVTRLPEIASAQYSQTMAVITDKLNKMGLSGEEIQQLYTIIQMQTNARNNEIRVVTEKFRKLHPEMKDISPVQIDGMLQGYSTSNMGVTQQYPSTVAALSDVQKIYLDEQIKRQERFDLNNFTTDRPAVADTGPITARREALETDVVEPIIDNNGENQPAPSTAATETSREGKTESKKQAFSGNSSSGLTISAGGAGASYAGSGSGYKSSSSSSYSSSSGSSGISDSSDTSSSSGSSNRPSFDDYSSSGSGSVSRTTTSRLDDDIRRMQEDIERGRKEFEETSRRLKNRPGGQTVASNTTTRRSRPSGYKYPKNVPVKDVNGDYYRPEAEGSELSSASNSKEKETFSTDAVASSGVGGGGPESRAAGRGGPVSFGGGGLGGGGGGSASSGRGPASAGAAVSSFIANAAVFEFNKYLPHSIFDVMGSIDKVIMMLGLEGKTFKTIEAIEETDPATGKIIIKYYERTFDFVPAGQFEKFKDLFSSKETRTETFKQYFSFPRTKENLPLSKKYSLATRQLKKEEVPHSYVLNIQNYILSDDEIRDTINEAMENLK